MKEYLPAGLLLLMFSSCFIVAVVAFADPELTREQRDLLRISTVCKERYNGRVSSIRQSPEHSWKVLCLREAGTDEGHDSVFDVSGM